MDNNPMSVIGPVMIASVLTKSLPFLVICFIGIVASLRSRALPRAATQFAVAGFSCILVYAILSGFFQYWYTVISVTRSESSVALIMQIWAVELLKVVLLSAGIAAIGRAVFSGRHNEN
jgi:hypothetical protein